MEIPAVGAKGNRSLQNYIPMTFLICTTDKLLLMTSKEMRWVKHVEGTGEGNEFIQCLMGNLKEGDHLQVLGIDGRIILK